MYENVVMDSPSQYVSPFPLLVFVTLWQVPPCRQRRVGAAVERDVAVPVSMLAAALFRSRDHDEDALNNDNDVHVDDKYAC